MVPGGFQNGAQPAHDAFTSPGRYHLLQVLQNPETKKTTLTTNKKFLMHKKVFIKISTAHLIKNPSTNGKSS